MRPDQLKINSEFYLFDRKYIVLSIQPPKIVIKRVEGDGETVEQDYYSLVTNPTFRLVKDVRRELVKEERFFKSSLDSLSEDKRKKVSERYEIIKPLLLLQKVKAGDIKALYQLKEEYGDLLFENETIKNITLEQLLKRLSKKCSKSVRTLKRYLASYLNAELELNNGVEGLISRAGYGYSERKDNRQLIICHPKHKDFILDIINVRVPNEYIPILKEVIEKHYLSLKNISIAALYGFFETACMYKKITPLEYITVSKIINRIDPGIKVRMREGIKAAEGFSSITRGYANEAAYYPLHIVQIDHTLLDLDVIDDRTGYTIGRPWITLGIDVFSRMVWCMYISFEPPSANVVRKAIQNGIFFKRVKEKYSTFNEWEIYGIPKTIYVDNGKDFKSNNIKRLVEETLNATLQYRPVKTPHYGAVIERLFGTINSELIHNLDGTRKSSHTKLGDYNPEEEACLTLSALHEILTRYITDIYHLKDHKGLPIESPVPLIRFREGIAEVGYPEYIPFEEEKYFTVEMLPTVLRPYTRDGVRLGNVLYKSEKLSNLIGSRDVKFKIKHDIDDISKIYLLPNDSSEYVEAQAVYPSYEVLLGVNRYTYKRILEILREQGKLKKQDIPETSLVIKAKSEIQKRVKELYKKSRKVRKEAKRMGVVSALPTENKDKSINKLSLKERILLAKQKEEANLGRDFNDGM